MSWLDSEDFKKVRSQLESYESKRVTLTKEEIDAEMPKIKEFYKTLDPSKDIYRLKGGVIAIISTPAASEDNEKVLQQKFEPSKYPKNKENSYSLKGCKFLWKGKSDFVGMWNAVSEWFKIAKLSQPKDKPITSLSPLTEKNIRLFLGKFAIVFGDLTITKYAKEGEEERDTFKLNIWQVIE